MTVKQVLELNSHLVTWPNGGQSHESLLESNQVIVVGFNDDTTAIIGDINGMGGICDDCIEHRDIVWWKLATVNIDRP